MSSIWESNRKTSICDNCPYGDTRHACFIAGLRDSHANITFLLVSPTEEEALEETPLYGRDANVLRTVVDQVSMQMGITFKYNVVYVVGKPKTTQPSKSAINVCMTYAEQKMVDHRRRYEADKDSQDLLHVIVPFGAKATSAVCKNVKKFSDARGTILNTSVGEHDYKVVPTLSLGQIHMAPGSLNIVVKDLAKAVKVSRKTKLKSGRQKQVLQEALEQYVYPENDEELVEITNEILSYTDASKQSDPDKWAISVDTETNSLCPWEPTSKVLMISVAWDDGKATAICLDHDEMPYSKALARECITKILVSPKPKIFHNLKFDWQFLELCEGIPVNNVIWDTMLAEHFLYEDKKGFYGLDSIASFRAPMFSGYKSVIQDSLMKKAKMEKMEAYGQVKPDVRQSYLLTPFYPEVKYDFACEAQADLNLLTEEEKRELFYLEKEYVEAHIAYDKTGDNAHKKSKQSARNRIRHRCKKYEIPIPATAKKETYTDLLDSGDGYENVPYFVLLEYAAMDADVTRRACKSQRIESARKRCVKDIKYAMSNLLVPASIELGKMEYQGTYVCEDTVLEMKAEISVLVEEMQNTMRRLTADITLNPDSNVDLEKVLTKVLPLPSSDLAYTENNSVSVTADWAKNMVKKYEGEPVGDFLKALLVYRSSTKAITFLDSYLDMKDENNRIHAKYNQHRTKTGRLSSSDPNFQQIPLYMVKMFEYPGWCIKQPIQAPCEDRAFWQMDISQAEIRVLCAYARDKQLIRAMRQGMDIHSFITAKVFDLTYEEVVSKKEQPDMKHKRTACKRVVFGTLYGAGSFKIAEQIFGSLSQDDVVKARQVAFAEEVMNTLFSRFPAIQKYVRLTNQEVMLHGYVKSLFHRHRRFQLRDVNYREKRKAQRDAVNFKIQSTSSDIVLSQLIEISQNLDQLDADMTITVHDSMGGTVAIDKIPKMKKFFDDYVVNRVKEKFSWLPVPFAYDLEVGPSYGEPIDYDLLVTKEEEFTEKQAQSFDRMSDRRKDFYYKVHKQIEV